MTTDLVRAGKTYSHADAEGRHLRMVRVLHVRPSGTATVVALNGRMAGMVYDIESSLLHRQDES